MRPTDISNGVWYNMGQKSFPMQKETFTDIYNNNMLVAELQHCFISNYHYFLFYRVDNGWN